MSNNIRKFRLIKNYSLKDLSKMTNLSSGYLSHLENGSRNNPSMKTMLKICNALGRSLTDIFDEE